MELDSMMKQLTPEVRQAVTSSLAPGEQVLWSGRSVAKAAWGEGVVADFRSRIGRMIALGLSIGFGLYVGWIFLAMFVCLLYWAFTGGIQGIGGVIAFLLLGWAISIVGYAALGHIGLPFLTMYLAGKRSYLLTNRSALVVMQHKAKTHVKRYELARLQEVPDVLRVTREGVGDLVFGYDAEFAPGVDGGMDADLFWDTGFMSCPDIEQVATLMRGAIVKRKLVYEHETMKEMQEDYQGYLRRNGRL